LQVFGYRCGDAILFAAVDESAHGTSLLHAGSEMMVAFAADTKDRVNVGRIPPSRYGKVRIIEDSRRNRLACAGESTWSSTIC
jgi:hypothetical protein